MAEPVENLRITISTGPTDLAAIYQLRYAVLRKPLGLSFESASFVEDDLDSTFHLLAWAEANAELIGCATMHEPVWTSRTAGTGGMIQLRGMAVHQRVQGVGVGRLIMHEAKRYSQGESKSLWCNARQSAVGFYEKQGFVPCSDWFDIPVIGPHLKMIWNTD
jgi:predicted GNAT family N-acyltransferase